MADQVQRTDQACETVDPLAEESEHQRMGGGHQCPFPSGVVCEVQLGSVLNEVVEMGAADSESNKNFLGNHFVERLYQ